MLSPGQAIRQLLHGQIISMLPASFVVLWLIPLSLVLGVARPPSFLPDWLLFWRPQWILLALIFWVLHLGYFRGGLFRSLFARGRADEGTLFRRVMAAVWLSGFVVDGLLVEPLGLNGAIFATIVFYLMRFQDRLALQTLLQRMIMIFLIVFCAEVFRSFVLNLVLGQPWVLQPLTVALTSMMVWPLYDRLSNHSALGDRAR